MLEAFPRLIHRGIVVFLQDICVIDVARAVLRREVFEYPDGKQVDDQKRDDDALQSRNLAENVKISFHVLCSTHVISQKGQDRAHEKHYVE